MGERYWITGVQLGILKANGQAWPSTIKLIDEVEEMQFIGNYPTDEDKKRFIKKMRGL